MWRPADVLSSRAARQARSPHGGIVQGGISGGRENLSCLFVPSWRSDGSSAFGDPDDASLSRDAAREALSCALRERRAEALAQAGARRTPRRRRLLRPRRHGCQLLREPGSAAIHRAVLQDRRGVHRRGGSQVKPLLLLDDVMSELDGARREALVSFIAKDVQTIVTTANLAYFDASMLSRADVVELPIPESGV